MYTATKREIIKFMKKLDMDTPRTVHKICIILRDNNKKYWFDEDKVRSVLLRFNAESFFLGNSTPYYYIEDWRREE